MGVRWIKMPDVGEGVAEAEIVEWAVKVGDLIKEDQVVAAVMTDKATVEIPTPVAGSVLALGGAVGDVLAVGAELIRIDAPGIADSLAATAPKSRPARDEAAPATSAKPKPLEALAEPRAEAPPRIEPERQAPAPLEAPQLLAQPPRPLGEKPLASPAVRLKAREAGVDLNSCAGRARGTHHPRRSRRLHRPPARSAREGIRSRPQSCSRDDQGRRHAAPHRAKHGQILAPRRPFFLR